MSDKTLEIRRAIMRLNVNDSATLKLDGHPFSYIEAEAKRFAKARKLALRVEQVESGARITRLVEAEKITLYPEIDALEVGKSHLFELPPAFHQRIRVAATSRNRNGAVRLACTREGEHIRVTRLPMNDAEAAQAGPITVPKRQTKYELERLATQRSIRFDIARPDQPKLRLAVSNYSLRTGWTIRCRLQDDGSMLVYRTDAGAPSDSAAV